MIRGVVNGLGNPEVRFWVLTVLGFVLVFGSVAMAVLLILIYLIFGG